MAKKCCVDGCDATSDTNRLFRFPGNDNLRKLWMSFLVPTSPILLGLSKEQLQWRRVCDKHFDTTQFDYYGARLRYSYPCLFTEKEIKYRIPLTTDEYTIIKEHNYCKDPEEADDDAPVDEPAILTGRQDNAIANEHQYSLPWEYPGISESEKKAITEVSWLHKWCNDMLKPTSMQAPRKWHGGKSKNKTDSKSTECEAPTPAPPDPQPLQSASPDEVDPLALDVKSEDEDSDTETHCTEEPVYDVTIKEHVTAAPLADEPGDVISTDANPVTPTLKGVLTTSDAVNIAPQTQAVTSQPRAPLTCHRKPSKVLHRVDPNEIKNITRPPIKLMKTKLPLRVLQKLKLDYQKQVAQPAVQLQQSANTPSPSPYVPNSHEIVQKRLLTELELCKKENFALRRELHILQKQNKLLENRLTKLKCTKNDRKTMFDKLTVNMSAPAKALFEMQLQSKTKKGRRYSLPGRIIALSIYKASPACYALLSKYFVLPSIRMVERFIASARKQAATAETSAVKETELNHTENQEDQDMLLRNGDKMNDLEDLDMNDYNINDTFQQEIDKTSEAVDKNFYESQAFNNVPQSSQAAEDLHQMTDDTSEVQSIELCEGQALQLADGRIFQLIDGQIVEVIGELKQDELNVPCDETRGTGSSDQLNPTVNDLHNTQECDQGAILVKPLWRYGSARDRQALLSETDLPQDNVSSTRQTIIDHYQRSHRDTSPHSMSIKSNSFDGRPANVDELCISNPLRSQVGEQATQIKHPHRTQQLHTKHKAQVKLTSKQDIDCITQRLQIGDVKVIEATHRVREQTKYRPRLGNNTIVTSKKRKNPESLRVVTLPVSSLKRVALDVPVSNLKRVALDEKLQIFRTRKISKHYPKRLKTKKTANRGPDMPDLTFS